MVTLLARVRPQNQSMEIHIIRNISSWVCINQLESTIKAQTIRNESIVNIPNWLCLSFQIDDGEWFDIGSVKVDDYCQQLDMQNGILYRTIRFTDGQKRRSRLFQRRFVSMASPHLSGLETTITPENWSGELHVRSAIDGRVENTLVKRHRALNNHHLDQLSTGVAGEEINLVSG